MHLPLEVQPAIYVRLITTDLFHDGKGSTLFSLEFSLDRGFAFLSTVLLPREPMAFAGLTLPPITLQQHP